MSEPDGPVRPVAAGLARYAGLAGVVLLTVAGWLGGALPGTPSRATLAAIWSAPHGPLTLGCWLAGTVLLVGAWWSLRWGGLRPLFPRVEPDLVVRPAAPVSCET